MRSPSSLVSLVVGASLATGIAPAAAAATQVAAGPPAPTSAAALPLAAAPSTADLEAYVTAVYADLFHRAPDPGGLATWVGQLRGGAPYGVVANGITSSDEYRSGLIVQAYSRYLGRLPDTAGLASWLTALQTGAHIEAVQAGFVGSDEFYARGGSTDAGWVSLLYQSVLGRAPAASEVDWWVAQMRGGAGRYDVARGFLYSTEHLQTVVDGYYQDLLDRHLDPTGSTTWVQAIQAGSRDEEIIAAIVSSAEYRGRVPTRAGATTRVGLVSNNTGGWSRQLSVSADGRWVAFASDMRVVAGGWTGSSTDVYLWDRTTGATTLVSAVGGVPGDGRSSEPSVSGDGRWVVFTSQATNLVAGDPAGIDVLVWDRVGSTTSLLPGLGGTDPMDVAVSADGTWVTYTARTPAGHREVFVTERTTGTTTLVSAPTGGRAIDGDSSGPSISADGRWIAFDSTATTLVDGAAGAGVYLWDRTTGVTTAMPTGGAAEMLGGAALSADGTVVAATGCVGLGPRCTVLAWDRASGTTSPVSWTWTDVAGDWWPTVASVSADGRRVAYHAWDAGATDANGRPDVLVTDRSTGRTSTVLRAVDGSEPDDLSWHPVLSADGRWLATYSRASNLVAGDVPGTTDIFVTDLASTS